MKLKEGRLARERRNPLKKGGKKQETMKRLGQRSWYDALREKESETGSR